MGRGQKGSCQGIGRSSQGSVLGSSTIQNSIFSILGVGNLVTLRFISSISHSRGYFPRRLYDSNLLFLIPGGIFPGNSTIHIFYFSSQRVLFQVTLRLKSSISHSRGYFPGRLYDSILLFLIPGGTFPGGPTIQTFYFSFQRVLFQATLRFNSSISHSGRYFPGRLYDSYLLFLIPGGIFPGGSTIQTFYFSFQGVFFQATIRFISSISHSRGYFPRQLYDSHLLFLIPGGTFPGYSTIQNNITSIPGVGSHHLYHSK